MFIPCVPSTYYCILATHIIIALQVIRVHYYYYYYYYYYVGRSTPGVLVISVLGRVASGLMKVGSRVTNGRRGVSCKIDKPWLVHGSECVFTCGVV